MSDETTQALGELMRAEEAKRDRNWNAADRWRVLQETITWAEAQATVRRNTRAECLRLQAIKLAREAELLQQPSE